MLSHKTLLDIWDLSHEDIKRCDYWLNDFRSEQNDATISMVPVCAAESTLVDEHGSDFEQCEQDALFSVKTPVSHPDSSYSLSDDEMSFKSFSSCVSEKTVCEWCSWTNELQLSWCENCGRVVNSSKDKCKSKNHLLDHKVQTSVNSVYPEIKNNSTSSIYGRTHRCLESRTKNSSYQRHWKTSSLTKSPTKQLIPKFDTASKSQL